MAVESVGTPGLWLGFTGFILVLLTLDLGAFHTRAREVEREWEEERSRFTQRPRDYDDDDRYDRYDRRYDDRRYRKKRWTEIFIFD